MVNKWLILALCVVSFSGCSLLHEHIRDLVVEDIDHAYFERTDIAETTAYKLYENQYKDEIAKIGYLINLVRYSPYTFYRNGITAPGNTAAEVLDYKVHKFFDEITTVEDFIEKVGSYSRTSGKEYYIIYPDHHRCPIKNVYYNELKRLYSYTAR
ncbi:MAG: DUF5329 domain-containing protein [Candidatus Omnitrophica bacterium]|nr:DUF5329 domain-containing protein [Candidatus Omnitrophota bacterium]